MNRLFVAVSFLIVCSALPARANVLQARVIEIHDGKTLTVENTGRRIRIALKAAEAPEMDQPFGEIARRHLSDLVLNRQVAVEYTGLGPGALLVARVFCEDRDIGLQMIRDGVAWFDRNYEVELGVPLRNLYSESELAARTERRGIWQDTSPMPPWEWRQAKAARPGRAQSSAIATALSKPASADKVSGGRTTRGDGAAGALSSSSGHAGAKGWPVFSPSDAPFSVRMPTGGKQFSGEVTVPRGGKITAHFYWVKHLKIGYVAIWASGPSEGEAVSALFDRGLDALNDAAAASGLPCEFSQEKDAAMGGYVGRRYKVHGCYFHGGIRNYFKVEGKTLKVIFVGVMSEVPDDPSIKQFLESFVID